MIEDPGKRQHLVHLIIGILVFGSIWGLLEATLGGFLHTIRFPNTGGIMTGIGVALMAAALAIYKKPSMLPGIGIVAASFKLLNLWLVFVPGSPIFVINPAMAIIFESLAFGLVAVFLMKRIAKNASVGVGAGVLAGLISATIFVYFAVYILNAPLFERKGVSSVVEYIASYGVIHAAFFGIFLPLGYLVGEKLAARTSSVLVRRPLYYATSAAAICLCWGIGVVVTMAGL